MPDSGLNKIVFHIKDCDPVLLLGAYNTRFNQIQSAFPQLKLSNRGMQIIAYGPAAERIRFEKVMEALCAQFRKGEGSNGDMDFETRLLQLTRPHSEAKRRTLILTTPRGKPIYTRSDHQEDMTEYSTTNDIIFSIGPAGTGKTYVAVAIALRALLQKKVRKIILTRPAVEAGEHLGFLPGDLKSKVDPYLTPLYEALISMLDAEKLNTYIQNSIIEIAPLAFMRGRTLDDAYIILDEAQNVTEPQLKMFLTRLGPKAKVFVTGDLTQIDLPANQRSGLKRAIDILPAIKGIACVRFVSSDVVRHPLVRAILETYEKFDHS